MLAVGIDIGGSSVKAALVAGGEVAATARSGIYAGPSLKTIRDAVCEAWEAATRTAGPTAPPEAIGVCVPGRRSACGERVELSVNLPCLNEMAVREVLPESLRSKRLRILSDAEAAALAVWREERLSGRLLALSVGTGVGAAVLDDGAPVGIGAGGPGHFGHIDVLVGGEHRRLEELVGLRALRARRATLSDASDLLEAPDAEDPVVVALASALRTAHAIYTPDHMRLLGGVGIGFGPVLPALRARVERDLTPAAREGWTLACGGSPFLAAIGAALEAE